MSNAGRSRGESDSEAAASSASFSCAPVFDAVDVENARRDGAFARDFFEPRAILRVDKNRPAAAVSDDVFDLRITGGGVDRRRHPARHKALQAKRAQQTSRCRPASQSAPSARLRQARARRRAPNRAIADKKSSPPNRARAKTARRCFAPLAPRSKRENRSDPRRRARIPGRKSITPDRPPNNRRKSRRPSARRARSSKRRA